LDRGTVRGLVNLDRELGDTVFAQVADAMTLEILGERDAVARISSLAALGRGEPGADMASVRQDLARRRATGR
jgi:hypothetical protein